MELHQSTQTSSSSSLDHIPWKNLKQYEICLPEDGRCPEWWPLTVFQRRNSSKSVIFNVPYKDHQFRITYNVCGLISLQRKLSCFFQCQNQLRQIIFWKEGERERGRRRKRRTEADRQTGSGRETGRQTEAETDRQTEVETRQSDRDRQTDWCTEAARAVWGRHVRVIMNIKTSTKQCMQCLLCVKNDCDIEAAA